MNATLDFRDWFSFHRKDRKLSRQALADLADVHVTVVTGLERDGALPPPGQMLALARALDPDPPASETLLRAGYTEQAEAAKERRVLVAESEAKAWSSLPLRLRKVLLRLAEVPNKRRWRCVELLTTLAETWMQIETGVEERRL